jgi:hypothetical protein
MLPSLGIGQQGTGGHGPCQGNALFVVKQLKQISSSPIRSRDSLKGGSGGGGGNGIRTRSADCEQMRKSSEETVNQSQGNTNPQSLAVSRVMKSIRKQRLIQQQTEVLHPFPPSSPSPSSSLSGRNEKRSNPSSRETSNEEYSKASPEG